MLRTHKNWDGNLFRCAQRRGRDWMEEKERRLVRKIPCVNFAILAIGYHIPDGKTISLEEN